MKKLFVLTLFMLTIHGCIDSEFGRESATDETVPAQKPSWLESLFWEDPNERSYNSHGHRH